MKISEIFNLQKSQAELDFVDIDISKDTPLFLDPFFLGKRKDRWSIEATLTIRSFFQKLIDLIRSDRIPEAKLLFDYLHEENSTCLGMSTGRPEGRGVGDMDASKIFEKLLESRAIQTGLIQDIEDNILFVDNFGKDKLSDMTTNIIKAHLIEYTVAQCELHNIPLTDNVPSGHFWSRSENDWIAEYTQMLIIDNRPILLVPKGVISFSDGYTPQKYYNHFVLNFLQNDNLRINSILVQERKNGNKFVTKKDVQEINPYSKEFLRRFTEDHPEVLAQFKEDTKLRSLKNIEITEISIRDVCAILGVKLTAIVSGNATASAFHNTVLGILELLFYPSLIYPVKEREIHEGRKRIDIVFDNAAKDGIFYRFSENMNLPCPYIFMECKNYSSDPVNPELDQLSGRFSTNRGRVGFLICRNFSDRPLFIQRCRDTYSDGRGLIVPLCDQDMITLLDNYNEFNTAFIDKYISDIVREIVVN